LGRFDFRARRKNAGDLVIAALSWRQGGRRGVHPVKLNPLPFISRSLRRRSSQALLLGCAAVAIQGACSSTPTQGGPPFQPNTSGTSAGGTAGTAANTAGTTTTAGTFGAAGTFGTAGTFGAAGTGGGTGGAGGAGTAGTALGGTGGTTAGTANGGTGGTPPPPVAYCMGKTLEALPYVVNTGFQPSGWGPDAAAIAEVKTGNQITTPPPDACAARVPNAVGACSMWRWTPAATTPGYSYVAWITMWDPGFTHPPVCLADGAKAVTFMAKGVKGGEVITVAGAGGQEVQVTLTTAWKQFEISLVGVTYNTFDAGVTSGFSWKVEPALNPGVTEWFLDDIKIVKDLPNTGAGGAGGAPQ
jgi:hypothetical protein